MALYGGCIIASDFVISSSTSKPTVYVFDDDFGVLSSLRFLLETDGYDAGAFRVDQRC
jgi:FixJ family two-component response regulator